MARVIAQGDMRPFTGRTQNHGRSSALDEIRKLLAERDALYARAAATVNTSGKTVKQTLQELRKALA
jgi:XRE family aerobic/anaerobic benzoate catabolism transcriptional regulator